MRLNLARMTMILAGSMMLATGTLAAHPRGTTASAPAATRHSAILSQRASTLLSEIQREATELRRNAGTLGTFERNTHFSWKSHAGYLDRVKTHINAVGKHIAELQRIQNSVLPWQQQAITQVTNHAAQVAASTQAALVQLNENRNSVLLPEYREHLKTIDDRSGDMKESVDKFLAYERAEQKFLQLRNELELGS